MEAKGVEVAGHQTLSLISLVCRERMISTEA